MKNIMAGLTVCVIILCAAAVLLATEDAREGWELVFSDDFSRAGLGDNWIIEGGEWEIRDGRLFGGRNGRIILDREISGFHRVEFTAVSEDANPNDLSPFIHTGLTVMPDESRKTSPAEMGYMLQFGGFFNTQSRILRFGREIAVNWERVIERGKLHRVIGEFDGEHARLKVDGEIVFSHRETSPEDILKESAGYVGIYVYTTAYIDEVRVYRKKGEPGS